MNRPRADFLAETVAFTVNGRKVSSRTAPIARLSDVLRDELGLTGTKIGCSAGDCGACTVLLDGRQVCSCLTALGQVQGRDVVTVEGLADDGKLSDLQIALHKHGAAQCGICTPGMLMAAADLLDRNAKPRRRRRQGRARRRACAAAPAIRRSSKPCSMSRIARGCRYRRWPARRSARVCLK
jgi:aerobic-type carbon monoxide dehydrogenase small subunit (CoxS/CutS family)